VHARAGALGQIVQTTDLFHNPSEHFEQSLLFKPALSGNRSLFPLRHRRTRPSPNAEAGTNADNRSQTNVCASNGLVNTKGEIVRADAYMAPPGRA
jgi:hypothetical protein